MKYQRLLGKSEYDKWLSLQTTIGSGEDETAKARASLLKFLDQFNPQQKDKLAQLTGLSTQDYETTKIKKKVVLHMLLLKRFMETIDLSIIQEARDQSDENETGIYLQLLEELLRNEKFPDKIFAHHIYRKRGSPVSWMGIRNLEENAMRTRLMSKQGAITRSLTFRMREKREFVLLSDVGNLTLMLMKKPKRAQVVLGAKRNYEVSGGSYTIIALDRKKCRVGVISGSKKEISSIYSILRNKVYKNNLMPTRSDINISGTKALTGILRVAIRMA